MSQFNQTKVFFIDLNGTLYFKGRTLSNAPECVDYLRKKKFKLRFLTNTDSKDPESISHLLSEKGFSIKAKEIYNPLRALFEFANDKPDKTFYFIVNSKVHSYFNSIPKSNTKPDFVMIGDPRTENLYEKLNDAFRFLKKGSNLIALKRNIIFDNENGMNLDAGSFVHLLEKASGVKSDLIGKPSSNFFRLALREINLSPKQVVVIGDDITADIERGYAIGAKTVLTQTGVFNKDKLQSNEVKPDMILPSFSDLMNVIDYLCFNHYDNL